MRDPYQVLGVSKILSARTKSKAPIASWRKNCIPTSIRAARISRQNSRKSPRPTICCRTRTSTTGASTVARSISGPGAWFQGVAAVMVGVAAVALAAVPMPAATPSPNSTRMIFFRIHECQIRAARGAGGGGAPEETIYALAIPFVEAALGGKKRVTLAQGKTIDVMIPAGVTEGHKLRLRGKVPVEVMPSSRCISEPHPW